ncbi:MAG: phosphodiester glycosidase family protein [Candidatus Roizmanbacteria bacterium]
MKYILVLSILGVLAYVLMHLSFSPPQIEQQRINPVEVTPVTQQQVRLVGKYKYYIMHLARRSVNLHTNLDQKLASSLLISKFHCDSAASGGFYDANDNPIGLFVSENAKVSSAINHDLFIGYLYSQNGESISISRQSPGIDVLWALQSGPIVWDEGPTTVRVKNDENARRIVAAVDVNGAGYLLSIVDGGSEYSGPPLTELTDLVGQIETREGLHFSTAINLDGGFHSFFKTESVYLGSLAPAGSILCVQ